MEVFRLRDSVTLLPPQTASIVCGKIWKRVFLYGQLNTQGRDCAARTSERESFEQKLCGQLGALRSSPRELTGTVLRIPSRLYIGAQQGVGGSCGTQIPQLGRRRPRA